MLESSVKSEVSAGSHLNGSPVLEPVTEGVHALRQHARLHAVLLPLLLLVFLLRRRRQELLLYRGGRGDEDSVGALPCQQVLVDQQNAVQELCRRRRFILLISLFRKLNHQILSSNILI